MENYTTYPAGTGRLKNYDGTWYVLDDRALLQTELDKDDYRDGLCDGMRVEYSILQNNDNPSDMYAKITKMLSPI